MTLLLLLLFLTLLLFNVVVYSLILGRVSDDENGQYRCVASTNRGSIEADFTISVKSK